LGRYSKQFLPSVEQEINYMGGGLTMVTYIVKKIKEIRDNQGLESAQTIYRQLYILKNPCWIR
jgi:hypothetical protein